MDLAPGFILYIVVLAATLAVAAAALVTIRNQRRTRCARCGLRLPRGAKQCPSCARQSLNRNATSSSRAAQEPVACPAELVAVQSPWGAQRWAIPSPALSIGREPDNGIVLAGELMVSRHHATIVQEDGQHVLYDLDSVNGTWVNDQRVFRWVLAPGDRVQIGQSHFVFVPSGASIPDVSTSPSASAVSPAVHVEGEWFAGYSLERLIGRGGMSEVFKARDRTGQVVAIKILQQTDPYLVDKFVQEGNRIGPLLRDHDNIVYVHEFGRSPDDRLYIVMEYVDGPSLRRAMQGPLAEQDLVGIMGQVCCALGFAHQYNVVHRDMKPENVLLTAEGKVKVLDFGIAKLTSTATVTRDKIVGTPEYISPEQALGEPVRPASDVYSLGIMLYELLCGSVPFRRPQAADPYKATMEVIRQHLQERPEPPSRRSPNTPIPTHLERVAMRALKKEIKARYPTAWEMGMALGHLGTVVRPTPPPHAAQACLVVVEGPGRGRRISLGEGARVLGRLDLDGSNTAISRHHATILSRGGTYWLADVSRNGTWLGGQRVYGEVPLQPGALITIGDNVLRLETRADDGSAGE